jgi:hypothetical protein
VQQTVKAYGIQALHCVCLMESTEPRLRFPELSQWTNHCFSGWH